MKTVRNLFSYHCLLMAAVVSFLGVTAGHASTDSSVFFHKAQIYLASGKYLEALGLYQSVADNDPDKEQQASALVMIGYIYAQFLDQPDMAIKYYDDVTESYATARTAGEALFKKGMVLYQLKQYRSALAAFTKYLDKYPDARWRQSARSWAESAMNLAASASSGSAGDVPWPFPEDTTIRVLLTDDAKRLVVTSDTPLVLTGAFSENVLASGINRAVLSASDGKVLVNDKIRIKFEPLKIKSTGAPISLNGKHYRGSLMVLADDDRLSAVNHVGIEEYLYGVVPCEVPHTWPRQALMAQAVAARTYALYIKQKSLTKIYDVRATTASQVYGGFDAEALATRFAVDQTSGQVLTYNGRLIVAYFHANSGGYTERPENVWGARVPYLKDQPDAYSKDSPGSTWEYFLSFSEAVERLREFGINAGNIKTVQVGKKTRSGRVQEVTVVSDNGTQRITSNNFRLAIGAKYLKSTCFDTVLNKKGILFKGCGYGHGVGMSQWGARQMALQGFDYKRILQHYYCGTKVAKIELADRDGSGDDIKVAKYR